MADKIRDLSIPCGLTPAMANHSNKFWRALWDAIDQAEQAGLSVGCLVSNLEFVKAKLIKEHLEE